MNVILVRYGLTTLTTNYIMNVQFIFDPTVLLTTNIFAFPNVAMAVECGNIILFPLFNVDQ